MFIALTIPAKIGVDRACQFDRKHPVNKIWVNQISSQNVCMSSKNVLRWKMPLSELCKMIYVCYIGAGVQCYRFFSLHENNYFPFESKMALLRAI